MKAVTTVTAACALSLFGTVAAQQAETQEEQDRQGVPASPHQEQALRETSNELFKRLDQNGDGSISKQEAQGETSLSGNWSKYDKNGDQVLNQEEFAELDKSSKRSAESAGADASQQAPKVEGFPATPHQKEVVRSELVQRLDKDGDGAISKQEAQGEARLTADWDQLDRNSDGKLDSSELSQFTQ